MVGSRYRSMWSGPTGEPAAGQPAHQVTDTDNEDEDEDEQSSAPGATVLTAPRPPRPYRERESARAPAERYELSMATVKRWRGSIGMHEG